MQFLNDDFHYEGVKAIQLYLAICEKGIAPLIKHELTVID